MLGNHEEAYDYHSCAQCLFLQMPAYWWEYTHTFLDKNSCRGEAFSLKTCKNTNYFHQTFFKNRISGF